MKAVVFMQPADGGRPTADPFEGPDCIRRARAFRDSVRDDFPGAIFAIGHDREAQADHTTRIVRELTRRES